MPRVLFLLILFPALACTADKVAPNSSAASTLTADPTNPFPTRLLGHRVFLTFRSAEQNLLGYSLRPGLESSQVFGARYWRGKESSPSGPGEDRVIVFDRKQAKRVGAALPGIGFNRDYQGEVSFKLILKGLRVKRLTRPVLGGEYRDLREARENRFVVSVLAADEIFIQALVRESGKVRVGTGAELARVFSGRTEYSQSARGVVSARNSIIGFATAKPRPEDLRRRGSDDGPRTLGIYDLEDRTGEDDYAFLSSTMRHKLEDSFQSIPRFHVVTARRQDAKYHLKGGYSKIGSRVQIQLTLTNTYNQRQLHKVTRVIQADDLEKLYDYQISVVRDFVDKFGVKLTEVEKERIRKVIRQAKDLDVLKEYRLTRSLLEAGKPRQCLTPARVLVKKAPDYLNAWAIYSNCLLALSRFADAKPVVARTLELALKSKNPDSIARAYWFESQVNSGLNDRRAGLRSLLNGLVQARKAYGDEHPRAADYLSSVAWGRMLASRDAKTKSDRRIMLRAAEKEVLRALNITRSIFGPDDRRVLAVHGTLANIQAKRGKMKRAITNASIALKLAKKHYGLKHFFTARRLSALAVYYRDVKRYDDSVRLLLEADQVYARVLGKTENLSRAINYTSIGLVYYKQKKYAQALPYFKRNVRAYRKIFKGKPHAYLAASYRRIGDCLIRLKDTQGALAYWRKGRGLKSRKHWLTYNLRTRYWRVAKGGEIPKGAMVGGKDYNGKPLYFCREEFNDFVVFGKIRPVYGACNYARGGRELRAPEYAVLVLEEEPRWIPVNGAAAKIDRSNWRVIDADVNMEPRRKIPATHKFTKEFFYACRVKYQGAIAFGKLTSSDHSTCRFGYGGVAYSSVNFEVLAEKPSSQLDFLREGETK